MPLYTHPPEELLWEDEFSLTRQVVYLRKYARPRRYSLFY